MFCAPVIRWAFDRFWAVWKVWAGKILTTTLCKKNDTNFITIIIYMYIYSNLIVFHIIPTSLPEVVLESVTKCCRFDRLWNHYKVLINTSKSRYKLTAAISRKSWESIRYVMWFGSLQNQHNLFWYVLIVSLKHLLHNVLQFVSVCSSTCRKSHVSVF